MTPGEFSRIEDALRRAYGDVLESVRREGGGMPGLMPAVQPGRPERRLGRPGRPASGRWLVPAAAAAAVAVIALVTGVIVPGALRSAVPALPAHTGYVVTNGAVIPVDLATGVARPAIRFPAQGGVTAAAIAPGGRAIYIATQRGYLIPVSTITGKAGSPIRIGGPGPRQIVISPGGRTAYILEPSRGVAVADLAANTAGFIKIPGASTLALTPDGRTLYVLHYIHCCTGSTVTPVDTATLKLLPPVHVAADIGSSYIAVAPDGTTAYVASVQTHGYKVINSILHEPKGSFTTSVLTPISTATSTALAPVQLGRGLGRVGPISFSPDGHVAYLGGSDVTAVNLGTGTVSWTARPPASANAPLVSPGGRTVYSVGASWAVPGTPVYRISAATGTLQGPVIPEIHGFVPTAPWNNSDTPADLSRDGATLYAQISDNNQSQTSRLEAVDTATGRVDWVLPLRGDGDFLPGR